MRKLIIASCLMLIATMVMPFGQTTKADSTFIDVGTTHRAQAEIYYLVNQGVVSGISTTLFAPDREVTRGEAAAMLGRALKIDGSKKKTDFSDVPGTHAFSGYINELVKQKVISGYTDGTFKPNQTLTRGDMAVLISRAFKFESSSVSIATSELMSKGISLGMGDGTFGEANNITRADFSVFLARSINTEFRIAENERFTTRMYVNAGADTLNMRSGPGTGYATIKALTTGTPVLVSVTRDSWSNIKVGNEVGFVHSDFLQTQYTPPPPVVPSKKPLKDLVVIIDPGHGGKDPGAAGHGFVEKNITLNIGLKMAAYFDKTPMQAKMTRRDDSFPTLGQRTLFAKQNNGDIFMSIHANSFNGKAEGQETFYYSRAAVNNPFVQESRALAIYTQFRMQEAWNLADRGVKKGNLHVLRENTMPAVLAEVAFIDNASDVKAMNTEAKREVMARGLFLATLDYYYNYEGRTDVASLYAQFGAKPSIRRH